MINRRSISWILMGVMAFDLVAPVYVMGSTSGPTQPEVQGFMPVSSSDMVDLFTGDFSYNIPLLDVGGYPINLFYTGGVTMEQEASWVGLGWNINPGVVNRSLRGVPDDHRGDAITRDMYLRPNKTFGITGGLLFELLGEAPEGGGNQPVIGGVSVSVSPSYNNYHGIRMEMDAGFTKGLNGGKSKFNIGLGLSSGSHSGLRLQPSIGYDTEPGRKSKLALNVGTTIDSREGMKDVSFGATTNLYDRPQVESYRRRGSSLGVSTSYNIGTPTYIGQIGMPMDNLSLALKFSMGAEAPPTGHPGFHVGASFSKQELKSTSSSSPGVGYMYLEAGQSIANATLDFSREKDGPYTPEQAALGISQLTSDIFSVNGQGIGGSYRAFRSEIGCIHDRAVTSGGTSGSAGGEIGPGILFHAGIDVMMNTVQSWSGKWYMNNDVAQQFKYVSNAGSGENVFFRNANEPVVEVDSSLFDLMGQDKPYRFLMSQSGMFDYGLRPFLESSENAGAFPFNLIDIPEIDLRNRSNRRAMREPRAQLFNFLTHKAVLDGIGLNDAFVHPSFAIPDHHMSEITILDQEGEKYVYGLPAYNILQEEVTFAVGGTAVHNTGSSSVYYTDEDNSTGNRKGIDHYYSKQTLPPYSHSFLLTAKVSADYSDIDDVKGPSEGDLGTYTRFSYELASGSHSWRTPTTGASNYARFERGLGATTKDDKGNYVYGEKEVWYLSTIETKDRIAVFELNNAELEPRQDAFGVSRNGSADPAKKLRYLKSISLYDKDSYDAHQADPNVPLVPIKRVHFTYDYSLCPNAANSAAGLGKLTLKSVYFTYGTSNMGWTNPYVFHYGAERLIEAGMEEQLANSLLNPAFEIRDQDRWGNFKPDRGTGGNLRNDHLISISSDISLNEVYNNVFPYAEQREDIADLVAGAWNLWKVSLPSGGQLEVELEADDYAYVQDKPATRMFRIHGVDTDLGSTPLIPPSSPNAAVEFRSGNRLYFKVPADLLGQGLSATEYVKGLEHIYFNANVEYNWKADFPTGSDRVTGYAFFDPLSVEVDETTGYGRLTINAVRLDGPVDPSENLNPLDPLVNAVSPIYRAAFEHARLKYPEQLYAPQGFSDDTDAASIGISVLTSLATTLVQFITGLSSFFEGPNTELRTKGFLDAPSRPLKMKMGESWIKLVEPDKQKKGGGHRVASIKIRDNWEGMEPSGYSISNTYTQKYDYGDAHGSWGVASYEPMIGADENPLRRPVYFSADKVLSSDERFYQEEPFGEGMYPSPVVGYSKVVIRNEIPDEGDDAFATGLTAHEFYTARDFPVRTQKTTINQRRGRSPGMSGVVGIRAVDHMHVTQGFVVETNDMHGKPKSVKIYAEGAQEPFSAMTYHYKVDESSGRLRNDAKVIYPNGQVASATIGRSYEFHVDLREFGSVSNSGGMQVNLDVIFLFVAIPIPPIIPRMSSESTRFRSAVLMKKIERHGLLERVETTQYGSTIVEQNVAYDAMTGKVLVKRTNNEFGDPVYSMDFPAYWRYEGMGPAYRNLNYTTQLTFDTEGRALVQNAKDLYSAGDELWIGSMNGSPMKGWITLVEPGAIHVKNSFGMPVGATTSIVRIVRSGRRNMLDLVMASIVSQTDPLIGLSGNQFDRVLQSSAIEYKDRWRTECACTSEAMLGADNPYRDNRRGVWRMHKERVWLSERTRSMLNGNVDLRHDGTFSAFSPFFQLVSERWETREGGWSVVREVQDVRSGAGEVEEIDALGIPSSATYGHKGRLINSVTRNAKVQETGFASFEGADPADCTDRHFDLNGGEFAVTDERSHTGRRSIRVEDGEEATLTSILRDCPEAGCDYSVNFTESLLTATGGTGPFTYSQIQVLDGDPDIQLTGQGVSISGNGDWQVSLVVTDHAGCTTSISLSNP